MPIFNNILAGASGQSTGYDIDQSLRFYEIDTSRLERTPSSAGNRKTWTWSGWVKRSHLNVQNFLFSSADSSVRNWFGFYNNQLWFDHTNGAYVKSDALYRDVSSWYHIVVAWDTTQATDSNRIKIYINGEQISLTVNSWPALNQDGEINNTSGMYIGSLNTYAGYYYDGYMSEVNFVDGQALTPASFGETNADTNQWQAIKYTGSYGTNGFYLKFQDSSALGDDSSGNTNDFTVTNLAATDQVLDSPTNNFSTMNPLDAAGNNNTFSEGNLKCVVAAQNTNEETRSTIGVSSGKWYWEFYLVSTTTTAGYFKVGLKSPSGSNYWNVRGSDGELDHDGSTGSSSVSYTTTNIVNVAVDMDSGKWWVGTNGSWVGDPSAGSGELHSGISGTVLPYILNAGSGGTHTIVSNFGQDSSFSGNKTAQGNGRTGEDFYYAPPTGYKALNTSNLDDPSIADPTKHFNTKLWTSTSADGTSALGAVTGVGFQPDLVWAKGRSAAWDHSLFNSVMGTGLGKALYTNGTFAAGAYDTSGYGNVTSFDSDGFTVGLTAGNNYAYNYGSGTKYLAWNWKAGGTASSNTDGIITSSVSANPTAGFSIVSWTASGTNNDTVGHGLSVVPELIIMKSRDGARDWYAYTQALDGSLDFFLLNGTNAKQDSGANVPTSSVFSVIGSTVNVSGEKMIGYCFNSVEGYSKVGIYTGNGSADGTFVYTGFRPAFILFKRADSASNWTMFDNKTDPQNAVGREIYTDLANAEAGHYNALDFVSNGFKLRSVTYSINASSSSFIYLAFAESPFKTSNAR